MPSESPAIAPSPNAVDVTITNLQALLPIDEQAIQAIVQRVLAGEGIRRAEVSVIVVDDAAIRVINARHLNHDWATDVVSFGLGAPTDPDFGGELVISAETAAREALLRQIDPQDELVLYLVHGLLHLCGFDDHSAADAAAMRRREGEVLSTLGIENPFMRERAGSSFAE